MAYSPFTATGDGTTTQYTIAFDYIDTADVKARVNDVATTAFTVSGSTVTFNTAPPSGQSIKIFRDTDNQTIQADFQSGSALRAVDLNSNFTQLLYVTQESTDVADTATADAANAVTTAASAVTTANTASTNATNAVNTANTASTNATAAVNTANTASTNATTAVNTANTASTNATNAVNTANTANTTANTANTTANTASTNASNAVTTANSASTSASNAVTTANAASATATAAQNAVADAVLYTPVANVSSIPGSPSNNDYVEVQDSTGIQSFSPLSGLPSGFTGASGLTVRLKYTTTGSTWEWQNYFANDPEDRYFKQSGGTITGSTSFDDDVIIKGDSTNGSGKLTLNCENNSHGVNIKAPPHSAAASYTLTLPNTTGTNGQFLTTDGSGGLSWSSSTAPVASVNGNTGTVVLTASDVGAATTAQGTLADSALQSSDIGSNIQAYDAGLAYLDGLNFTNEATFKAGVNLEIGVDVQAYDANLPAGNTIVVDGDVGVSVQAYDADTAKTDVAQSFTAAQRGSITTLTSAATVTPDFAAANNYTLTLAHNATIANPTNLTAGQSGSIFLVQDGTGSRTGSWGSYWDFAGGVAPVLTTSANAVDRIDYVVRSSTSIHAVATLNYS